MVDKSSGGEDFSLPSWRRRIRTAPALPGEGQAWVDVLPKLLAAMSDIETTNRSVDVPALGSSFVATELLKMLGPSLVVRRDSRIQLAEGAAAWLTDPTPHNLILHLHRHVQLIGELLALLVDGPLTHEQLRDIANSRYGMGWSSLDPLRRRTTWLRATGHVELYDGAIHLTTAGAAVLAEVTLGAPEEFESDSVIAVPDPLPEVDALLRLLDLQNHGRRTAPGSSYIPSPEGVNPVDVIRAAVSVAIPSATETTLEEVLQGFGVAEVSARQARGSLKSFGLIRRIGPGRWAATEAAVAWLDSGDDVQFARILHAHLWFVGELMQELQEGPLAAPVLAARSRRYGRAQVSKAAVSIRCALLRGCGLLDKLDHQQHQLTPAGRGFLTGLPLALPLDQDSEESPEQTIADERQPSSAASIAVELLEAAVDSANPVRFEIAVGAALTFLGFGVEHLSGPGRTDLAVILPVPQAPVIVAVEAKTSAEGPVSERDVSFQALREHRGKIAADVTMLVGPAFHRRVHAEAAADPHVAVMNVQELADAVALHWEIPFAPEELRALCEPALTADTRSSRLADRHQVRRRLATILDAVITQLDLEIQDEDPMYPGGWLGPGELRRDLRKLGADNDIIMEALSLLASPFVGAIEESKGRYRLAGSRVLAVERIRALAKQIEAPIAGLEG